MDMNEMQSRQIEQGAERFLRKYRPLVEALESHSLLSKVRAIRPFDIYAMGSQLEMFETYKLMCEEEGTASQLGRLPMVALDVIAANYGSSPLSAIASVQPIQEEQGLVYFKKLIATQTRGNVTAGQAVQNAVQLEDVAAQGYAHDLVTENVGTGDGSVKAFNVTVSHFPIRPGSLSLTVAGTAAKVYDDMEGNLLGKGVEGAINYATGAVTLSFVTAPTTGQVLAVTYATDFEADTNIPQVQFKLTTKPVHARVYALKSTVGLEQAYALRQRFGMVADDEIANDLVNQINAETMNVAISLLRSAAGASAVNWDATPDSGVAYFDHKQALKDQFAKLEAAILGKAGKGTANVHIIGRGVAAIAQTLPGFQKLSDGTTSGPHLFGTLDGQLLVRVPNSSVLPSGEIISMYNGTSPFEAALVYSPYMPLVVTTAMPTGMNPLLNQKAAAVWAGTDVLVPQFLAKGTVANVQG